MSGDIWADQIPNCLARLLRSRRLRGAAQCHPSSVNQTIVHWDTERRSAARMIIIMSNFLTRTLHLVLVLNCVTNSQTYVLRHIIYIDNNWVEGSRLQTDWLDTQIFWSECFLHFKIKTLTTLESYFLQRFLKTFFRTYFSIFVGSIDWGWS